MRVLVKRGTKDAVANRTRASLQVLHVDLPAAGTSSSSSSSSVPICRAGAAVPLESGALVTGVDAGGRYLALIRKEGGAGGGGDAKPRQVLEVWDLESGGLTAAVYLDASVHGDVVADGWFASDLAWSPCGRYIAYVAEAKAADVGVPLFDFGAAAAAAAKDKGKEGGDAAASLRGRGADWELPGGTAPGAAGTKESWGEKYDAVRCPRIFMVDLARRAVVPLPGLPDTASVGQPVWAAVGGRTLLAHTRWTPGTRRLGMIYCFNRPCSVWLTDVTGVLQSAAAPASASPSVPTATHTCISDGVPIARSPTFLPVTPADGSCCRVAYLAMDGTARSTHNGSSQLRVATARVTGDGELVAGSGPGVCAVATVAVPATPLPWLHVTNADVVHAVTDDVPRAAVLSAAGAPPPVAAFPGLYTSALQSEAAQGRYLYLSSLLGSRSIVLRVDPAGTDAVAALPSLGVARGDHVVSNDLLAVGSSASGRAVLALAAGSPSRPDALFLAVETAPGAGDFTAVPLPSVTLPAVARARALVAGEPSAALPLPAPVASPDLDDAAALLARLDWCYMPHPAAGGDAFLVYDRTTPAATSAPLLVFPHGGPHSTIPANYFLSFAFAVSQGAYNVGGARDITFQKPPNNTPTPTPPSAGFAVLVVNYRGSLGFGEAATASLAGGVGSQDVGDVYAATTAALAASAAGQTPVSFDAARVVISGGSHGGFLSMHAIGQHPEMYKAAAVRNPVTNIAAMVTTTDIPDWCYTEALGCGAFEPVADGRAPLPTGAQLAAMFDMSPAAHAAAVRAPTLFVLGQKDRRVPFSQGLELYYALKARGVPTRVLAYPDDVHAIDKPASEAEAWVSIVAWLLQYSAGAPPASLPTAAGTGV